MLRFLIFATKTDYEIGDFYESNTAQRSGWCISAFIEISAYCLSE